MRPDERTLTQRERGAADTARAAGFNRQPDPVRLYLRTQFALEKFQPRDSSWQDPANWADFLRAAFGMPLREYVEQFAGPLCTSAIVDFPGDFDGTLAPGVVAATVGLKAVARLDQAIVWTCDLAKQR